MLLIVVKKSSFLQAQNAIVSGVWLGSFVHFSLFPHYFVEETQIDCKRHGSFLDGKKGGEKKENGHE